MNLNEWLREEARAYGVELDDRQLGQFSMYLDMLTETNKVMNLTAITEPREVYVKHFLDSLSPAKAVNFGEVGSLIDVGTGAGFPGIPLKIAFPSLKVVLLDSLNKRVGFLREVTEKLGLEGVECVHGRAEEAARNPAFRERFDVATARAVARMNVLTEYVLPFVRVNGTFCAMKGAEVQEEVREAKRAFSLLGKATVRVERLELPLSMGTRHLVVVRKNAPTPKAYPRKAGTPSRQPLV
ncbi:16S rRNA (guanine(527)-N(7))-methyltransferase RsmG [Staphylospora marina]|uniref:16S rRNA (guanine(527)-N(7))-methyltransferase RsmG n=1 Tax=Staphylospora marina TaxID=2490858 RepID=UPI000F5BC69F|nr:16S rRNA (guanine(527)-N(7))-methyltransferase RsmG [Staphylospora marina]